MWGLRIEPSFRGARSASPESITTGRSCVPRRSLTNSPYDNRPGVWIPGPRRVARPGMTSGERRLSQLLPQYPALDRIDLQRDVAAVDAGLRERAGGEPQSG